LDSIIQNEEIKSNYKVLAKADLPVSSVSQVARKYNVFPNTIYCWRQKHKNLSSSEAKCLKILEKENLKLKNRLAEKELQIQILAYYFFSFGYRRITAILKQMGYHVNHKRIYRIYKLLNLQKSTSKGYKKKHLRIPFKPINPSKTNELWSLDVIEDTLQKNGLLKKLKFLT